MCSLGPHYWFDNLGKPAYYFSTPFFRYSVDVRPGERDQQDSSRNGEASSADGTSPILETPSRRDSGALLS